MRSIRAGSTGGKDCTNQFYIISYVSWMPLSYLGSQAAEFAQHKKYSTAARSTDQSAQETIDWFPHNGAE